MKLKDLIKNENELKVRPNLKNINAQEIKDGIKTEMEHTNDMETAKTIALQHLSEDPKYYSKLKSAGLADELDESRVGDMYIEIGESIETIEAEYKKLNEIGRLNPSPELNLNLYKLKNVIVSLKKIFGDSYTFDN